MSEKWPIYTNTTQEECKDHFISKNGISYAGTHLLIDLWEANKLDDITLMEEKFRECVDACGATLLHIYLQHFTPNGGISGIAVLAESHISVHTWPEKGFAAFDIFMCGDANPCNAIPVLVKAFSPSFYDVNQSLRGIHKSEI